LVARNLEEKMDEKLDNVDLWINFFEIKLPLSFELSFREENVYKRKMVIGKRSLASKPL